jgi:hypothetical protein
LQLAQELELEKLDLADRLEQSHQRNGELVQLGLAAARASAERDAVRIATLEARLSEGPIRRTREGGSEWEPIKILLDGDRNSNKTNAASNTRLRLTTEVGQAHVAIGVPLDLGTNTHSLPTRERSGTPNLESTDPHRSDR